MNRRLQRPDSDGDSSVVGIEGKLREFHGKYTIIPGRKCATMLGAVFGIILAAACAGDAVERTEDAPVVRDSSGVRIVSNSGAGRWTEETGWRVEPDLRIGDALGGSAEYQFGRITDIDVDDAGRILVLDEQAAEVRVFDPDGRFAFAFGRSGRGPGEFSIDMFELRVDHDGRIAVRDGINRRDNMFDANGNFIRAVELRARPRKSAALPDGGWVDHISSGDVWDGLIRVAAGGEQADTIVAFDYDIAATRGFASQRRTPDDRVEIVLLPVRPVWATTSDGRVVAALTSQYRIEVRRPDGALKMIIQKAPLAQALGSTGREGVIDRVRELMREAGMAKEAIARSFQRFAFVPPDTLPPVAALAGGPDGTIWVQRTLPIEQMTATPILDALLAGGPVWDVFDRDGRLLGSVTLPPRFTLKRIRGQSVYGVHTDELDVQRVVRLATRRP